MTLSRLLNKSILIDAVPAPTIWPPAAPAADAGALSHKVSPFGGGKASGFGPEGAQGSIEEYLETKTFHFTELADPRYRLPGLGRRDLVPAAGPI